MKPLRSSFRPDTLFEIERWIARRADEIARAGAFDPSQSLAPWREAEREVWVDADERGVSFTDNASFQLPER